MGDAIRALGLQSSSITFGDIRSRLWNMINYAIGRHDYYERVRRDFLTIGLGLIGAATALEAILFKGTQAKAWFLVVGGGVMALVGLGLVFRYVWEESPDYPYRNALEIRSWFYIYNVPSHSATAVRPNAEEYEEHAATAKEQLLNFSKRWLEWVAPTRFDIEFTVEDLQQVFALYRLQQYKRLFSRKMAGLLLGGATVFFLFLVAHVISLYTPNINSYLWASCCGAFLGGVFGIISQYNSE